MAEKRKGKKRKEELFPYVPTKPTKDEYAVAKWLRQNVPTKKTKFLNHNVEYFTAVKAVDALLESHWAVSKEGEDPLFPTRQDVVQFLDIMLRHKFFHRAKKVPVSEQELKAKLKKKDKDRKKAEKGSTDTDVSKKSDKGDSEKGEEPDSTHEEEKEKRKRKIRLEMHLQQLFVDGLDAYVWIYDPIPMYYWFFGTLLVLGAIAICLFPLWPPSVRKGVYYLSVAAAGFLIYIISLAILRLLVFCLLWLLTMGKHHLWLFPNLTEDVGFLASFWPLYKYEYKGPPPKKTLKAKEKDSDNEEEKLETEDTREEENQPLDESVESKPDPGSSADPNNKQMEPSESESESSQKSQTGKDFEMVEREEVES